MTVRFRVLLVLVLVVVIVAAGGLFYLDRVVGASIERGGSYALGVDTELRSVRLGLLSGEFSLSGLTVANPPGFETPHFFRLEREQCHQAVNGALDNVGKVLGR